MEQFILKRFRQAHAEAREVATMIWGMLYTRIYRREPSF